MKVSVGTNASRAEDPQFCPYILYPKVWGRSGVRRMQAARILKQLVVKSIYQHCKYHFGKLDEAEI